MTDRTYLVLVSHDHAVCRLCPALVPVEQGGDLCARCCLYTEVERITHRWQPQQLNLLTGFLTVVVQTLPPEDAEELFALLAALVRTDH